MVGRRFYIYFAFISLIALAMFIMVPLTLVILFSGIITWIFWHTLTPKIAFRVIPRRLLRENIIVGGRPRVGEVLSFVEMLRLSSLPALFSFSLTLFLYEIANVPISSIDDVSVAGAIAMFLLPLSIFISAKWVVEYSGLFSINRFEKNVSKLTIIEYIEEFIGFGSILAILLTLGQLAAGVDLENLIISLLALFYMVLYPSTLATILFFKFSYSSVLTRFLNKVRPFRAEINIELRCPRCNQPLEGGEFTCPNCNTQLR